MNLVFICPNFPQYFENFCDRLRKKGVSVLGIGDSEYDKLTQSLKSSLNEYYKVTNLEDYEEVYKACGYFIHKYGRLDAIESLNEYWLINEAKLRLDFNVEGVKYPDVMEFRKKSAMKKYFKQAGVPSARYHMATDYEKALEFVKTVGYPIIAKPDAGVGATNTFKIKDDEGLKAFFASRHHDYILEEFIDGDVITFEGITDRNGYLLFYSSHEMLHPLMDTVNKESHLAYFSKKDVDPKLLDAGRKVVNAFQPKQRFFHYEFFRLNKDCIHGKKSDYMALEVNMRPPGGLMTEVINNTYDIDIYDAWANTMAFNCITDKPVPKRYIGYASRKYRINYRYSNEDIYRTFGSQMIMRYEVEAVFAKAMGDFFYMFRADNEDDIKRIVAFIHEEVPAA